MTMKPPKPSAVTKAENLRLGSAASLEELRADIQAARLELDRIEDGILDSPAVTKAEIDAFFAQQQIVLDAAELYFTERLASLNRDLAESEVTAKTAGQTTDASVGGLAAADEAKAAASAAIADIKNQIAEAITDLSEQKTASKAVVGRSDAALKGLVYRNMLVKLTNAGLIDPATMETTTPGGQTQALRDTLLAIADEAVKDYKLLGKEGGDAVFTPATPGELAERLAGNIKLPSTGSDRATILNYAADYSAYLKLSGAFGPGVPEPDLDTLLMAVSGHMVDASLSGEPVSQEMQVNREGLINRVYEAMKTGEVRPNQPLSESIGSDVRRFLDINRQVNEKLASPEPYDQAEIDNLIRQDTREKLRKQDIQQQVVDEYEQLKAEQAAQRTAAQTTNFIEQGTLPSQGVIDSATGVVGRAMRESQTGLVQQGLGTPPSPEPQRVDPNSIFRGWEEANARTQRTQFDNLSEAEIQTEMERFGFTPEGQRALEQRQRNADLQADWERLKSQAVEEQGAARFAANPNNPLNQLQTQTAALAGQRQQKEQLSQAQFALAGEQRLAGQLSDAEWNALAKEALAEQERQKKLLAFPEAPAIPKPQPVLPDRPPRRRASRLVG